MKVPGSQLKLLFDCQLEKVQKVGAQFPTAPETSDFSHQWQGFKESDLSIQCHLSTHCSLVLQLEKAHSRTLAKA